MTLIYQYKIPSSHIFVRSQLQAPPGVSIDALADAVGNQIASTIIHEAAHGEEWVKEYLFGDKTLENMNRREEESIAERAEERAGLSTDLTQSIFDDSETLDTMSPERLLDRAVSIANAEIPYYLPRELVADADLGSDQWGEFTMMQGEGVSDRSQHTTVAWSDNDQKLLVDVSSIIEEYNRAISQGQRHETNRNMTNQVDGMESDYDGVSRQSPPGQSGVPGKEAVPSIPGR